MIAILKKELRASLREKLGWALLVSIPALFALFSLLTVDGNLTQATELPACEAGRRMLGIGVNAILFVALLFVPALSAVNLVREDEKKTLEVLLASPRSGLELGLAKLLSPVVVTMLSALLAMPLLVALSLLGGVRPWEPVLALGAAAFTALAASAAGMAVGALMRSTGGAVLVAGGVSLLACVSTSWPLWSPGCGLFGAALPLGMARCILYCEELSVGGWHVPLLLPGAVFLSLVCACLFCASLPSLTTVFRRRALPVRLTGVSALAFLLLLAGLSWTGGAWRELIGFSGGLLMLACLGAVGLLVLERLDSAGIVRTLPGTAEAEANAAGGAPRRAVASRLGLAALPLVATVPAILVLAAGTESSTSELAQAWSILLAALAYSGAWVTFCVASSSLWAMSGRRRLEAIFCQVLPLLVVATVGITGCPGGDGLSGPIQLLAGLSNEVVNGKPISSGQLWMNALAVLCAAAMLGALGCARRRRGPGQSTGLV